MAHADATDPFDNHWNAAPICAFAQGIKNLLAPFGHATRAKPDVDLGHAVGGTFLRIDSSPHLLAGPRLGQRFIHLPVNRLRGNLAHRGAIQSDHGRKRATPQAGDGFNGELPRFIGIGPGRNSQLSAQRILHPFRTRHVTSRAPAHLQNPPARRPVAKHIIKRGYARNGGRLDLSQLSQTEEHVFGQVTVMLLQLLQYGNERLGLPSMALDGLLDKVVVHAGHVSMLFRHFETLGSEAV